MLAAVEGELLLTLPMVTGRIAHHVVHRTRGLRRIHTGALTGSHAGDPQAISGHHDPVDAPGIVDTAALGPQHGLHDVLIADGSGYSLADALEQRCIPGRQQIHATVLWQWFLRGRASDRWIRRSLLPRLYLLRLELRPRTGLGAGRYSGNAYAIT